MDREKGNDPTTKNEKLDCDVKKNGPRIQNVKITPTHTLWINNIVNVEKHANNFEGLY